MRLRTRIMPPAFSRIVLLFAILILYSCDLYFITLAAETNTLPADALFSSSRLLDIQIEIPKEDWDKLRLEHHDLLAALGPTRLTKPEPKPYHRYQADVTINGVAVKSVGLQKRGFLGSASSQRPSLGIRFDAFDDGKTFAGLKRISLNNNLQDPSQFHQVLAYALFAKAGVPAPRCNLASVSVNGKSLGIYSHIEPIEKPFLLRNFKKTGGNLYEGQVSDFRPDWVKTFEKKNNQSADRGDLQAVVEALQEPDDKLLARLSPLVDIDAFLTFWAMETLIGHWDSYSNGGNNFLIYNNPLIGKFQFIPWGADSVLGDIDPFRRQKTPESVKAGTILPYRLYQLPEVREKYRARLRELLRTVWKEDELLLEIERLQQLLPAKLQVTPAHYRATLNKVRRFIRTRRMILEAELDGTAPEWKVPLRPSPCIEKIGAFEGTFSTEWRNQQPWTPFNAPGKAAIVLKERGTNRVFATQASSAGPNEDHRNAGLPGIVLTGTEVQQGQITMAGFIFQPEFYKPGTAVPMDGFSVGSAIIQAGFLQVDLGGIIIGTMNLKEAGTEPGAPVSGSVKGEVYQISR